jgi:hypothetical protein
MKMLKEKLKQLLALAEKHKEVLIRTGMALTGAALGAWAATLISSIQEEEEQQSLFDLDELAEDHETD